MKLFADILAGIFMGLCTSLLIWIIVILIIAYRDRNIPKSLFTDDEIAVALGWGVKYSAVVGYERKRCSKLYVNEIEKRLMELTKEIVK